MIKRHAPVPQNKPSTLKENVSEILLLYEQGLSQKEIADKFKTYNTSIKRILERNNIRIKGISEMQEIVKENPFSDLEKEEVRYWLGYLIADGNVSNERNRINISSSKDKEHLEKYLKFIGNGVKLNTYLNKKYNVNEYSVNFSSVKTKEFLISIGITPKKSLNLELKVPLNSHMLRGIFDGDGCFSNNTYGITCASLRFCEQIIEFLKEYNIQSYVVVDKRGSTCYAIYIANNHNDRFHNLLYSNANIYMERKYNKTRAHL